MNHERDRTKSGARGQAHRMPALALVALLLPGCGALEMVDELIFGAEPAESAAAAAAATSGTAPPPAARPDARAPGRLDEAWDMLAVGHDLGARSRFLVEAERRADDALPVAGWALSVALAGDLGVAADGMQSVLQRDAAALARVPVTPALDHRLSALVARYHERVLDRGPDRTTLRMLAALYYLRGEHESVRSTLDLCRRLGDRSSATAALAALVADDAPARRTADAGPPAWPAAPPASRAEAAPAPVVARAGTPGTPEPDGGAAGRTDAAAAPPAALRGTATPAASPVDYDRLRAELMGISDTLDRFTQKLLGAIGRDGGAASGS